jgi:hypothetical protein
VRQGPEAIGFAGGIGDPSTQRRRVLGVLCERLEELREDA